MKTRESEFKNMLSVQQAAERLGISDKLVRSLINRRKLKAVDFADGKHRCYRIKPEWIDDLVNDCALPALKPARQRHNGNLQPSKFSKIGVTR